MNHPCHVQVLDSDGTVAAGKREGNSLKGFEDFPLENGSSQGQNLALTVLSVPNSLDSGR